MSRATKRPTVVISFEGVVGSAFSSAEENAGEVISGAMTTRQFLVALRDGGWKVVLLSQERRRAVKEWLRVFGWEQLVDAVSPTLPREFVAVIDPRAVQFRTNYDDVLHQIEQLKSEWEK